MTGSWGSGSGSDERVWEWVLDWLRVWEWDFEREEGICERAGGRGSWCGFGCGCVRETEGVRCDGVGVVEGEGVGVECVLVGVGVCVRVSLCVRVLLCWRGGVWELVSAGVWECGSVCVLRCASVLVSSCGIVSRRGDLCRSVCVCRCGSV